MNSINDRVAYLKGLAEGMQISDETNEGKLFLKALDVLEQMADELTELRKDYDELNEYVESIDDDLADIEDLLLDDEDEDDENEEDDEDEEGEVVEYTCPHCGNEVTFDIDGFDFEEENLCPACGKPLFPADGEDEPEA